MNTPLKILFVGNSYTYCNELPRLLEALAEAADDVPSLATDQITPGGCTLQRHWTETGARAAIARRRHDLVVLQEHSTRPITDPWLTEKFAGLLHKEIKAAGAETVFYLTWAREHLPETQRHLTDTYRRIARACGARVAPVGEAWKRALRARPDLVLHAPDHSHPNRKGSYLAACVFFASLFGRSPAGLPGRLTVVEGGKRRVLLSLRRADAAFLQDTAWRTARALRSGSPARRGPGE